MSLFGAMSSAISGLNAQSNAFGNISDNVANSQTIGFKRVDTSFEDFLTTSTATVNDPGAVVAHPAYVNNIEGAITQTDNPLGLAIAGQGFFAVSQQTGQIGNTPTFNPQQFYTRAGDFQLDKNGYMVNSAGQFLNGWSVDPQTGTVNQNSLAPIQVSQTIYNPVRTTEVDLSANLPATPATGTATAASPITSNIDVYDALGTVHSISLNWVQSKTPDTPAVPADPIAGTPAVPAVPGVVIPDDWQLQITDSSVPPVTLASAEVKFGPASSGHSSVPSGTVGDILTPDPSDPTTTVSGFSAGGPAVVSFTANFPSGSQTITLNVGTYGQTGGVTQYAGTAYNLRGLSQNGVPPGSFAGVSTQANGSIVVNYDNGQTRAVAEIPVVTFNNPDALQRQNGQAFTSTLASGNPLAEKASTNGAGNLVTQSLEGSNVDIANEFSKLIIAQRAYSANTKVVTTADELLQQTIDMKR